LLDRILNFGSAGWEGYLLACAVLLAVAALAMWKGRKTAFGAGFVSLFHAVMIFAVARAAFWAYAGDGADETFVRILIFTLTSVLSFYFLALAAVKLSGRATADSDASAKTVDAGGKPAAEAVLPNSLLREMLLMGIAVAFIFIATPVVKSTHALVPGFINALLLGATARLAAFALRQTPAKDAPASLGLAGAVSASILSWILYQSLPLVGAGTAERILPAARWMDAATLLLVIGAVVGGYVRWGAGRENAAEARRTEMEAARAELARLNKIAKDIYEDSNDLMIKQKEQALAAIRRAESLEKMLEMGIAIPQRRRLDDVLHMVVELVHAHLGFRTVTLRLFNEKAQSFETRAHVGLPAQAVDRTESYRIPLSEYEKMTDPRFRISKSYFVKSSVPLSDLEEAEDDEMLVRNTWDDIDMLIVPLGSAEDQTIGFITAENPENPTASLSDVIETLETISTLAVAGIRNARILEELKQKDEKLTAFTDKLSSVNKMKSSFVATMSHEFRTPLTSIHAYCDTLIKNADSVDKDLLKEFLYVIDEESKRLMSLVEDILDFSQIESGAMKFERKPCDLGQIVKSSVEELSRNFDVKEVTVHQDLPAETVNLHAERDLIKQLVVSLLHNASKFCKTKGNVWIRLQEEVASVRIVVEDDGIGIPEDQLEKVFEQFYQVDQSDTREHGGSGLGLAMCRSVVEWHEGRIWVQNMTSGGARFVAVLPKKQVVTRGRVMNVASTVRRLEIEKFLELVVENVAELMMASKVSLMILDPESEELRIEAAIGTQEEVVEHTSVKLGEGIAGRVAAEGKSMLVKDIEKDGRIARSNNGPVYGSKSFLCVPIRRDGATVGVLNVSNPARRRTFTEADCQLLEVFAERLARAVDKIEKFTDASLVYERVRDTYSAMLEAMRFVDARDSKFVTRIVTRAAEKLGMDEKIRAALPYLLAVYDLGLSRIGNHILKKPSELTREDRDKIESHTVIGDELLRSIESESAVREIVLYHHENYDGSGYPGRLAGRAIPLGARILRVADSLRALISERPYQRRYSLEEAMEILKHRSGAFFDPEVVGAFVEAMGELATESGPRPLEVSLEALPARGRESA
jgi:signal transduction histidine kinase/HD-GYP domain-containing protein (c-di-GMP phosphodiesterase class II)